MAKQYWLFKSEPDVYSLDDLKNEKKQITGWDGIRNYRARNYLRDEVKNGDRVFFYHSRIRPPAVVGVAEVVKEAYPDTTGPKEKAFNKDGEPIWVQVDVQFVSEYDTPVTIDELRETEGLEEMVLLNNSRLSIQPVTSAEWKIVDKLGRRKK